MGPICAAGAVLCVSNKSTDNTPAMAPAITMPFLLLDVFFSIMQIKGCAASLCSVMKCLCVIIARALSAAW